MFHIIFNNKHVDVTKRNVLKYFNECLFFNTDQQYFDHNEIMCLTTVLKDLRLRTHLCYLIFSTLRCNTSIIRHLYEYLQNVENVNICSNVLRRVTQCDPIIETCSLFISLKSRLCFSSMIYLI